MTIQTLTATSLADIKAASTNNVSLVYDRSLWTWTGGNYTGQADDVNIIKADSTALSVGAWVRQKTDHVTYRYDTNSVTQTATDTVSRGPLNLYDKIPRQLWAAIENGTSNVDLTQYVTAAIGTGRAIRARQGRFRMKLNVTAGSGISIRGEGRQLTYFENVDDNPIITLDSSTAHIVGFELEDCWLENRAPATYNLCDLLKITGSGDGETWQNDSHHFRNLWFFKGRDNFACYKRCIWPVFDGCNFTGALRDGIHVETASNVNQWEFRGRTILKGCERNGLFFKHDFQNLATGWLMDNISTEDSGFEGWRLTGTFGVQAFTIRNSTFENNARLVAAGSSAIVDGVRRRKAGIFSDMRYVAGLDINATTFYNNAGGGSGGNPDQHIYVSAVDAAGSGVVLQTGSIANSRFLPTQTGVDVVWPIGLTYHGNNTNSGDVLSDSARGLIDLRKFAPQDEITAALQLTGVESAPTGTARFVKQGNLVTAYIPRLTGTSNSTTATLTGLPPALWPIRDQTIVCITQDATAGIAVATCTVKPDGIIALFKDAGGGSFAPTGAKGVALQTLTWAIS